VFKTKQTAGKSTSTQHVKTSLNPYPANVENMVSP